MYYKIKVRSICFAFTVFLFSLQTFSQARIILNGAKINITGSANLVIDNPNANALTRYDGHIISEGENNNVKWNIGNTTGSYEVPFGYGSTNYLPLGFTKDAGTGSGIFSFATYKTGWQNSSQLPSGVTNVAFSSSDNSAFIADRFWKVSAVNYTTKPTLSNLSFTYLDAEILAPNTITESNLQPRRWNAATQTWTDYAPSGSINTTANTFTITSVPAAQQNNWWLMVDNVSPLPVKLLSFTAVAQGADARLNWATATETNSDHFTLERSINGVDFFIVADIAAAVNSQTAKQYAYLDRTAFAGKSYYRLKQTDRDGSVSFAPVRSVFIKETASSFAIYPNPATSKFCVIDLHNNQLKNAKLEVIDLAGKVILLQTIPALQQRIYVKLADNIAAGVYTIKITATQYNQQKKLVVY